MVKKESLCCGCVDRPCLGSACPNYEITIYECDNCKNNETLYYFEGEELCLDCIEKRLKLVDNEDYICDSCNEPTELYEYEGEILCIDCIRKMLDKVEL